jgi:hypothetical protein
MPSTLLLVYDAEDVRCRRLVDWAVKHDRNGLVVTFPYQNGEVVRIAPELAGLDYLGRVYTLDMESREVRTGLTIVAPLLKRIPGWSWAEVPARLPLVARLLLGVLRG